jgi:hypothetical protein
MRISVSVVGHAHAHHAHHRVAAGEAADAQVGIACAQIQQAAGVGVLPGKIRSLRASTGHFAANVWIAGLC